MVRQLGPVIKPKLDAGPDRRDSSASFAVPV
jgi:hypothetical protein